VSERSSQESELLQPRVMGDQEALDAVAPVIYQALVARTSILELFPVHVAC
jgi:hypothetical protein